MDGHGVFVWSSVLLTSFLLLSLVLNPILKRRKLLKKLKIELMGSDNASY
jgi:heme exporter protein CcmD